MNGDESRVLSLVSHNVLFGASSAAEAAGEAREDAHDEDGPDYDAGDGAPRQLTHVVHAEVRGAHSIARADLAVALIVYPRIVIAITRHAGEGKKSQEKKLA